MSTADNRHGTDADYAHRSATTLIRGGTLILPDGPDAVRGEPGDLLIRGERIARLGEFEPGEWEAGDARIVDASGCAVLPGFVQSHVHLCQTLMRGVGDDLELLDWLRERIWPLEAAHDPGSLRASARLSVAELLLGGTTAVQTMETVRHTEAVLEVLVEAGMHAVAGKCLMDDPETCPDELVEPTDAALGEAVDLIEDWDGRGGRLRVCLAPRFAVSCTDDCLREVGRMADAGGWRIHTHASENRDEVALVSERTGGRRNVEYLDEVGCTGDHVGLAHCIWIDDGELELLAGSGTHVLHCPASNLKLASGVAPVPEMLRRGIRVSLGADGAPCNNSLDAFREMRLAATIHNPGNGVGALPAPRALSLATRGGAAALGLEDEIGVLREGAMADLVVVDLDRPHLLPAPDPVSALVYSAVGSDVRDVWLSGRPVVEDGRLTLWDEEQVRAEAVREAAQLYDRAGV